LWDQDAARDVLRQQVVEHLASPMGVLVVVEAEFVKATGSCVGTYRHTDGLLGRPEHRQRGVFLGYASPKGEGYLDRELFLPRSWTERQSLRVACGLPSDVTFATCSQMARRMLSRALHAGVPHSAVAGGPDIGADAGLRMWLEDLGETYVLGVPGRETVRVGKTALRADAITSIWPDEAWHPPQDRQGADRGELMGAIQLEPAPSMDWRRWLIAVRYSWDRESTQYFMAHVPAGTEMEEMYRILKAYRQISLSIPEARRTVGLDRFSGKSWEAWYRHMTVALMAYTMRNMLHKGETPAC